MSVRSVKGWDVKTGAVPSDGCEVTKPNLAGKEGLQRYSCQRGQGGGPPSRHTNKTDPKAPAAKKEDSKKTPDHKSH